MRYRPRWTLLGLGALVVIALYLFPLWRSLVIRPAAEVPFALASAAQRDVLRRMDRVLAATAYAALITPVPVPTGAAPPPLPPGAQAVYSAAFTEIDAVHRAEGQATIYRLADGRSLLRLTGFSVTNAPELALYLTDKDAPRLVSDLPGVVSEFRVGGLRGSQGEQQIDLPTELNLDQYRSVVIVSEALQTIYSVGRLR